MFGGIVETIGIIKKLHNQHHCVEFIIAPQQPCDDLAIGQSIAVNGVCLTITDFTTDIFHVTAVPETLRVTNLSELTVGDAVNLERSLKLNSRLGGHYVQGHVDGVGEILDWHQKGDAPVLAKISIPTGCAQYLVKKGYITLDGMSITLIEVTDTWFTVTFIPHTQAVTIVHYYKKGQKINIEVDILGKYVERILRVRTDACNPI
jgi:riboflavin synthase